MLRYADCPQNIVVGANTFLCPVRGTVPGHKRGKIRSAIGLQAETLDVTMLHDANTLLLGGRPGAFAKAGGFDGALLKVDKLLTDDFNNTTRGVVNLFSGGIFDADAAGNRVEMKATTDLVFLNNQFPRRYLLPSCNNALFDSRCKLLKTSFKVSGTATGGTVGTITSALGQATGYFALGYVEIKTGVNAGLRRMVKLFASGTFTLLYLLPAPCANGDTFDAYPGCDKLEATCISKFNNKPNFGGYRSSRRPRPSSSVRMRRRQARVRAAAGTSVTAPAPVASCPVPAEVTPQQDVIVAAAQRWLGTPYHHAADVLGVGVDCAMLIVRVYCDLGWRPRSIRARIRATGTCTRSEERFLGWIKQYARTRRRARRRRRRPVPLRPLRLARRHRQSTDSEIVMIHASLTARCVERAEVRARRTASKASGGFGMSMGGSSRRRSSRRSSAGSISPARSTARAWRSCSARTRSPATWAGTATSARSHTRRSSPAKGGGAKSNTTYTYSASFQIMICEGDSSIAQVYDSGNPKSLATVGGIAFTGTTPPDAVGAPDRRRCARVRRHLAGVLPRPRPRVERIAPELRSR